MRTSENFSVQTLKLGSELLISLQGDLDMYTVPMLQEAIDDHMSSDIVLITMDCDWVKYVDSAFLQLLTRMSAQVPKIRIINASRTIIKIFEITGLDEKFIVHT